MHGVKKKHFRMKETDEVEWRMARMKNNKEKKIMISSKNK